jgi:pyridoxal biosynthesis lyase PdxS
VTIEGTNFGETLNSSFVTFAGVEATNIISWSDYQIVAEVPEGATSGYVGVTVEGVTSNGKWFTVTANPVINTISPTSGPVGTQVTIEGSGFGDLQGTSKVTFAGVEATNIISWSDYQIVAEVPEGATSGYVGVTVEGVTSNGKWFTVE